MNSWNEIATTIGYKDEEQMLYDMYIKQRLSLITIGEKLGSGKATIRNRLIFYNIDRREKGGPNNPSQKRLFLHLLDQRYVRTTSKRDIAKLLDSHPSTVWRYLKGEV